MNLNIAPMSFASKYQVTDKKNKVIQEHDIKQTGSYTEPQVVICSAKNDKTGNIEDQTMQLSHLNKLYSIASNKAVGILVPLMFWGGLEVSDLSSRYNAFDYSEPLTTEYTEKTKDDICEEMTLSPEIEKNIDNIGSQGKRFLSSLAENKENLMNDLNLNDKQYDDLADIALKISKNESQFGKSLKYKGYMVTESYMLGAYGASKLREHTSVDKDGTLSRGMTQYKVSFANDKEKKLLDKYDVTYNNLTTNIQYPEKSAIATMIHLGTLQKGYENYSKRMNEIAPDLTNPDVQKSIQNAKTIIFDDELRPKALKALTQKNDSKEEAKALKDANLTKNDLDDLRTFAKGVKLSEKAYVASRWPGKNIYPYGKSADLGCANLLKAAAGVGYIANITKDIEIPE